MKTITITKNGRTISYNPMFVKSIELVRYENNDNWCVNVVHVINDREVAEPIIIQDCESAENLYKEFKSCLESI